MSKATNYTNQTTIAYSWQINIKIFLYRYTCEGNYSFGTALFVMLIILDHI